MSNELHFNIVDQYFKSNSFVEHHINSVNYFYENELRNVLNDLNPITYQNGFDKTTNIFKNEMKIYFGGKGGKKIYYGKPIIVENDENRFLYPNEARLRNMTYSFSVHLDIDVYSKTYHYTGNNSSLDTSTPHKYLFTIEKYYLGNFPIMINSNLCILNGLPSEAKYHLGECYHDYGGYFIIDGKEKALIPQESFANNMMYIREVKDNIHDYSVEIRSISDDETKPKRTFAIRRVAMKAPHHNEYLSVFIPNVRKSIPLFTVFRALGIESDREIVNIILGDKLKDNEIFLELLKPSVTDSGGIYTQHQAISFIKTFVKEMNHDAVYFILSDYFLPHLGEMNFKVKAHYLGYMILELLKTIVGLKPLTDRDHYKYKRVETSGYLMKELFSEYANIMYKTFYVNIEMLDYYNTTSYEDSPEFNEQLKEELYTDEYVNISDVNMYPKFIDLVVMNHMTLFNEKK